MRSIHMVVTTTTALLLTAGLAVGADGARKITKDDASFGSLRAPDAGEARKQAEAWLRSVKADDPALATFKEIWESDRLVLDKIAETLALGDADAARVLREARNADAAAPVAIPAVLKDKKKSPYFRANLAAAYGKALTGRKVYEEALEAFALAKPEDVADPAAMFFHKAVCEHSLLLKDKADGSIDRLLVDVQDAPERYRMVAALMHFDMLTWQEKDLGWIARKMSSIQRRLDLNRGGKDTQKQQKEVLVRLDEMIKELENQQKSQGNDPNDGNCPGGGDGGSAPGSDRSASPQRETSGGSADGPGQVDMKKVREVAEVWGKLPEKEQAKAMRELTRGMPAKDRAVIEQYLKEMQKRSSK